MDCTPPRHLWGLRFRAGVPAVEDFHRQRSRAAACASAWTRACASVVPTAGSVDLMGAATSIRMPSAASHGAAISGGGVCGPEQPAPRG